MKKLIALVLSLALAASALVGCGGSYRSSGASSAAPDSSSAAAPSSSTAVEPAEIRIAGLKDPTSMGMVKLMEDAENGEAANN